MKKATKNWIATSEYNLETAGHMLKSGRYLYVIYMCHLSLEKLLKAIVAQTYLKQTKECHQWLKQHLKLK